MAADGDDHCASFKFPLSPLSPERVNIPRQSVAEPKLTASPIFGCPAFGPPGNFSKSAREGGPSDSKSQSSPNRSAQHRLQPPEHSPGAASSGSTDSSNNTSHKDANSSHNDETNNLSISNWSPRKLHSRTNSDVQCMVARFNSLDIKDHADLRKKDAAALKRAQMGREEAEEEVKRLREEARASKREIDEGKERETRVVKRLDVVMEDLHRTKETQAHAQALYEKEIRKARKEAFKASSTLVKLQEELKIARKALGVAQSDLDLERIKGTKKEQDAFTAQYQLVGVQQELAQSQALAKVIEEERDALKMTLKGEEVARIAAEGRIALPAPKESDDEFGSPKKQVATKQQQTPSRDQANHKQELQRIRIELDTETKRRELAEDQVEFMKMECQFGCCSCKIAEAQGASFIHDGSFESEVQKFKDAIASILRPVESPPTQGDSKDCSTRDTRAARLAASPLPPLQQQHKPGAEDAKQHSPNSDTMRIDPLMPVSGKPSPPRDDEAIEYRRQGQKQTVDEATNSETVAHTAKTPRLVQATPSPDSMALVSDVVERPKTQYIMQGAPSESGESESERYDQRASFRTITTTVKIPLAEASTPDYSAFCSPMKLTREEAIERLRQRRGRARSVAGTPKKPGPEEAVPRRDISAPEVRDRATPKQPSKGPG